ncbi:N-acetyltransferas-like protein 9 [Hyaloscypha hepaticicola]|uniref:N-acetyltransferas-like protein 9 n=1 Tax=Hyaloscypha hepaticicola TaxID=2082293 RepID=A0A2J6QIL6_9HELO|nr:N-acetyltransferas-like protein 9 [Hyaloscypha hepaticicola]
MLINQKTAISTSSILLVPYEAHHVTTYHEWMKDPEIQETTASEPLTLDEEYAMQRSWRTDHDKLTFIACHPLPQPQNESGKRTVVASTDDTPDKMLGDVNLFLSPADEDDEGCIGELELMIAPTTARRKGYGRAAILTFLSYIETHLDEILGEYRNGERGGEEAGKMRLLMLRVKIGGKNEGSIGLFEGIGFVKTGEGENYFGEVEMVFEGAVGRGRVGKLLERFGIEGYTEMEYVDAKL